MHPSPRPLTQLGWPLSRLEKVDGEHSTAGELTDSGALAEVFSKLGAVQPGQLLNDSVLGSSYAKW